MSYDLDQLRELARTNLAIARENLEKGWVCPNMRTCVDGSRIEPHCFYALRISG